ncbi:hypothetical protein HPB47_027934 [Ixodes persulcatus]|uniref:Uncharacterized protein n=1 Tax=Ixodes persulcatus TaxID=34615 RepID=A0AC60PUP3_IXOPE|nr:hypothetical protein HPB47_027934 [Ixodes persulcatus]
MHFWALLDRFPGMVASAVSDAPRVSGPLSSNIIPLAQFSKQGANRVWRSSAAGGPLSSSSRRRGCHKSGASRPPTQQQLPEAPKQQPARLGYCATEAHSWARGGASASAAATTSLLWNAQTAEARAAAAERAAAAAPARQLCSRLGGSEARALAYGFPCGGFESRPSHANEGQTAINNTKASAKIRRRLQLIFDVNGGTYEAKRERSFPPLNIPATVIPAKVGVSLQDCSGSPAGSPGCGGGGSASEASRGGLGTDRSRHERHWATALLNSVPF